MLEMLVSTLMLMLILLMLVLLLMLLLLILMLLLMLLILLLLILLLMHWSSLDSPGRALRPSRPVVRVLPAPPQHQRLRCRCRVVLWLLLRPLRLSSRPPSMPSRAAATGM